MMLTLITLGFMCFDVLSGQVQAIRNKTWKSSVMREGLYHKLGLIMAIVLAYALQVVQGIPEVQAVLQMPFTVPTVLGCEGLIIWMESGSILENIKLITPAVAKIFPSIKDE